MENDVNLNTTHCIIAHDNIGSTTYYNICNGSITSINWGVGDYVCFIFLIILILLIITFLINFIKDLFE